MKRITSAVLIYLASLAHAGVLPPQLEQMQKKFGNTKTLTAQFVQKQKSLALGRTKQTSGRIYIRRPDSYCWETTEPEASKLVSNGKKVWFYTPPATSKDKGSVLVRKAKQTQSRILIDLLSGTEDLSRNFKINEIAPNQYELRPIQSIGDVDRIQLFIERKTGLVYKLMLFTNVGNQTDLELENVELGPPLPDAMFNFVPPPNTEEIQ